MKAVIKDTVRLRVEWPSVLEEISLIVNISLGFLEGCGVPSELVGDDGPLDLSIGDAVANAVKHGNMQDLNKKVVIDIDVDSDEIVVRVSDEGNGFDPDSVPNPTDPDNLLKPDGRGIYLMRKLMDSVEFSEGGTTVTMSKLL